jgi:hypothetical protein
MNAMRDDLFPLEQDILSVRRQFQNRRRLPPVSSGNIRRRNLSQEIVMTSSRNANWAMAFVCAAASSLATCSWAGVALASQGPGGGQGTASSITQLAMAVLVYGAAALVVGAGLIRAALRH